MQQIVTLLNGKDIYYELRRQFHHVLFFSFRISVLCSSMNIRRMVDDIFGRHALALSEVESLNLTVQPLVYPHLRLGKLTMS